MFFTLNCFGSGVKLKAMKFEEISRLMILIDVKTKNGLLKFLWPSQKISALVDFL